MTAPAAAPKPCKHPNPCRCDVADEIVKALVAAGDAVTLHNETGRAADRVSRIKSGRLRVRKGAK